MPLLLFGIGSSDSTFGTLVESLSIGSSTSVLNLLTRLLSIACSSSSLRFETSKPCLARRYLTNWRRCLISNRAAASCLADVTLPVTVLSLSFFIYFSSFLMDFTALTPSSLSSNSCKSFSIWCLISLASAKGLLLRWVSISSWIITLLQSAKVTSTN